MPLGILTKLKEGVKDRNRKLSVQIEHIILDGILFGKDAYNFLLHKMVVKLNA